MTKILKTTLISYSVPEDFVKGIKKEIDIFQDVYGLEVEILFSDGRDKYSALILGREKNG